MHNIYTMKDIKDKNMEASWSPILMWNELQCDKCVPETGGFVGQLEFDGCKSVSTDDNQVLRIYYRHTCTKCDHSIFIENEKYPYLAIVTYDKEGEKKRDIRKNFGKLDIQQHYAEGSQEETG